MTPDVEFQLTDMLHSMRPRLVRPNSYAEACEAVALLEAKMATDIKAGQAYAHELLHTSAAQRGEGGFGFRAVASVQTSRCVGMRDLGGRVR